MPGLMANNSAAARFFVWVFWGSLALRLVLASTFPLTGDEALFIQWGHHLDAGYYDHPPMIGWWLAALLPAGDALGWLRLPTVGVTALISLGLLALARSVLPPAQQHLAWWMASAYLLLPWSLLFVLVTTDTPLVLLAAGSMAAYLYADRHRRAQAYALAGLLIGLAFLSKYFAVLVGLAYAVHVLGWRRERWRVLPGMLVMALPALAWNLAFNATHGWPNILFNLLHRHAGSAWSLAQALKFAAMVVYLLTPWLLWMGWRAWRAMSPVNSASPVNPVRSEADGNADVARTDMARAAAVLWMVPVMAFGLMSLRREVGLHWVLAFVAPFILWLCLVTGAPAKSNARAAASNLLDGSSAAGLLERGWRRATLACLALSTVHLLAVAGLMLSPLSWWPAHWHERVVFTRKADEVTTQLVSQLPADHTVFAQGYTPAAVLAYHLGHYVPVFGMGSRYARQDDLWTDFRTLDGKSLRIFSHEPFDLAAYQPFFASMRQGQFEVDAVPYFWLDGQQFSYPAYRERVLTELQQRYHTVPGWLPVWGHPFCERYGFSACAPARP